MVRPLQAMEKRAVKVAVARSMLVTLIKSDAANLYKAEQEAKSGKTPDTTAEQYFGALTHVMGQFALVAGHRPLQALFIKAQDYITANMLNGTPAKVAGMTVTKKDITMKSGDVVPKGTRATVKFLPEHDPKATSILTLAFDWSGPSGRDYQREPMRLGIVRAHEFVTGISKPPGLSALQRMSDNAAATTPTGKRVEEDGWASDGSPAWPLVLGMI